MKKGNLITAGICILLALTVIFIASGYPSAKDYGTGVPGPGLWPIAISCVVLFCSLIMIIKTLKMAPEDDKIIQLLSRDHVRVYISMGVLLLYTLLLPKLGFIVATTFMLFGFIQWFGRKKPYVSLVIALVITLATYFIFKDLLNVPIHKFGIFSV